MTTPVDLMTPQDAGRVRERAARLLRESGAAGVLPTPVDLIVGHAKLIVEEEELNPGFLSKLRRGIAAGVKVALSKVRALLHFGERLILVGSDQPAARRPWLKLHETGHSYLPWQSDVYGLTEDCEHSLDPTITERFENEANYFASEVLFQGEHFVREARDLPFGVLTPVNQLAKRYGASIYTTLWRYVSTNPRACAVLVLKPEQRDDVLGPIWPFQRFVASKKFTEEFGDPTFESFFRVGDGPVGAMLPRGKQRLVCARDFPLTDLNGDMRQVLAEAFYTKHNVFVFIMPAGALTRAIIVPGT